MDIIWLELILVAVVALGLGFWQLYDVNKEIKKDREQNRDANEHPASGDSERSVAHEGLASASKAPDQVTDVRDKGET